jgi:RNA polymerase sigma-70 factor (ECF subfamily)
MAGHAGEAIERAREGNLDAFREVVEAHSAAIFRVAYRLTGNREHAEDVVQDTFFKAYRNLQRFDGRAQAGTWLYRIAVNCALDLLRRQRREPGEPRTEVVDPPAAEPGPERQARSSEVGAALRRALPALSPLERTAFLLRHCEGRSIAEICRLLGVGESAGKQAVFRAVRKLRGRLAPLLD